MYQIKTSTKINLTNSNKKMIHLALNGHWIKSDCYQHIEFKYWHFSLIFFTFFHTIFNVHMSFSWNMFFFLWFQWIGARDVIKLALKCLVGWKSWACIFCKVFESNFIDTWAVCLFLNYFKLYSSFEIFLKCFFNPILRLLI